MLLLSVPFYDFPSSPILIIGAIGIVVALAVFFLAYQKYFNSPFNKEFQLKKKALLNEKKELYKKLEKIELDLKNL
jgi:beta-lactamase regulating signal transducer with metallopeptidase domain